MKDWIEHELETLELGDKRLNKRCKVVLDRLSDKPSVSIPAACKDWADTMGTYRFLQNDSVTSESILEPHYDATLTRIKAYPVVLMIQDTTELDYTGKNDISNLGTLTYDNRKGLLLHPMLAITPDRVSLGVVDAKFLRENYEVAKTAKPYHYQIPLEQKESYRWLQGYRLCSQIAQQTPDTMIVNVADRESDIYEIYEQAQPCDNKAEWIIRSSQNRRLDGAVDSSRKGVVKLWDSVEYAPSLGQVEFTLPKSHDRKDKKVTATIKAKRVTLYPPNRTGKKLAAVTVYVVKLKEINPPQDQEPIEWILLTSIAVHTLKEAITIVQWYCCRWQIEIYFRILKSGCKVEALQLEDASRIKPAVSLYMIIAWRIFYCLMLGRNYPNFPCDLVFDEDEWQSVYVIVTGKQPPSPAPSLGEMIEIIAKLGGYLGRKHDGPPGPKTLWIGFQRMADFALAWKRCKPQRTDKCV